MPRPSMTLLDLLNVLPLNDVDASMWEPLSITDHRSFRLTCRQGRHLANQLTTSTHHTLKLRPTPPGASVVTDHQAATQEERLARQAFAGHAAFLTRLPRLTSLRLSRWPSEADLASTLLACGTATQGRLTKLALQGEQLSSCSLRAARVAFPQLRELSLFAPAPLTPSSIGPDLKLRGPVFLALHGTPWLTKLSVKTYLDIPAESLRSLAGLATLKILDLNLFGPSFQPRSLLLLTGLHGLEECCINVRASQTTLPDFAALLGASRLTQLELLGDWGDHLWSHNLYPRAAHAAALALLGGLSHLQTLNLGHEFAMDNATFAAVCRLTQLTQLRVGGIQPRPAAAAPAHFLLLQQLHLGWYNEACPPYILKSLLSLLPLPSLAGFNTAPVLLLDVSHDSDDGDGRAARWAATLQAVLQGLASSPLLRHEQGLWFSNVPHSVAPRSLLQLAQRLRPTTLGLLSRVHLHKMKLEGAPWGVLQAYWPALRHLSLVDCKLSSAVVTALVGGALTLQHLSVHCCKGPGGDGWLAVAAHCCRPLQVTLFPDALPAEVLARCRAVQQSVFGVQNIEWLD